MPAWQLTHEQEKRILRNQNDILVVLKVPLASIEFLVSIFPMNTLLQTSIKFSIFKSISTHDDVYKKQIFPFSPLATTRPASSHDSSVTSRVYKEGFRNGFLLEERKKKRVVLVKSNQGFGFNGGGGGKDNGATARLLANLALAVGLTYLSVTGQLGWILDAIVSIWVVLSY